VTGRANGLAGTTTDMTGASPTSSYSPMRSLLQFAPRHAKGKHRCGIAAHLATPCLRPLPVLITPFVDTATSSRCCCGFVLYSRRYQPNQLQPSGHRRGSYDDRRSDREAEANLGQGMSIPVMSSENPLPTQPSLALHTLLCLRSSETIHGIATASSHPWWPVSVARGQAVGRWPVSRAWVACRGARPGLPATHSVMYPCETSHPPMDRHAEPAAATPPDEPAARGQQPLPRESDDAPAWWSRRIWPSGSHG